MSDHKESKVKMGTWEDYEAIRNLKYRYWRLLERKSKHWHGNDRKERDAIKALFCDDAIAYYPTGNFEGNETIANQLTREQGPNLFVNQGHNPEITFTSKTTAKVVWLWSGYKVNVETNTGQHSAARYYDECEKTNGQWKIKSIRHEYIFNGTDIFHTAGK